MIPPDEDWTTRLEPGRPERFDPGFADRVISRLPRDGSLRAPARAYMIRAAMAAAAAVLLLVSVNGLRMRSVGVAPGQPAHSLNLPDGSEVTLATGSTLRFRDWSIRWGRRSAELRGEAFFEIAAAGRPFDVETFNAIVRVTGTRFNLRAWPESARTVAALEEGSISLRPSGAESALAMSPGQVGRVEDAKAMLEERAAVVEEVMWTTGGLAFRDAPLSEVLRALERRYRIIIAADSEVVLGRRTTYIDPSPSSAEAVLDAVAFALGLRYSRTVNGFRLHAGSDQ